MTMARWFGRPPCSLLRTSASRIAALEWQYWETSDVPSALAMCENPCGAPLRLLLRLPLRSKLLCPVYPCLPISTTHSKSESRPKAHCTRATPVGSSVPLHVQISLFRTSFLFPSCSLTMISTSTLSLAQCPALSVCLTMCIPHHQLASRETRPLWTYNSTRHTHAYVTTLLENGV